MLRNYENLQCTLNIIFSTIIYFLRVLKSEGLSLQKITINPQIQNPNFKILEVSTYSYFLQPVQNQIFSKYSLKTTILIPKF